MIKNLNDLDSTGIVGIFFDIDDTFSTDGKISAEAYRSLWDLKNAGKIVVPITGRPAGWCDHIARMWPVTAVVGENGAFYYMLKDGKMVKEFTADPTQRASAKKRLEVIKEGVFKAVPGAGLASDQNFRDFDLAIDFCEDVPPLPQEDINKIVEVFEKYGASVKVSSIHVNGWFGTYDKLTTARIFARKELKVDLEKENAKFVFVGDSPNDEPMFEFFKNSIGVANVLNFKDQIKNMPKFVTSRPSGAGFVEVAKRLLG